MKMLTDGGGMNAVIARNEIVLMSLKAEKRGVFAQVGLSVAKSDGQTRPFKFAKSGNWLGVFRGNLSTGKLNKSMKMWSTSSLSSLSGNTFTDRHSVQGNTSIFTRICHHQLCHHRQTLPRKPLLN